MIVVDLASPHGLVGQKQLWVQCHPTATLLRCDHTSKSEHVRHWTPEASLGRGLLAAAEGLRVARPFPGFGAYHY